MFDLFIIFLSTLSLRRATNCFKCSFGNPRISIHALLAESDLLQGSLSAQGHNFYPRSPCGERLGFFMFLILSYEISIHALLAESDLLQGSLSAQGHKFLSTLSLRRATRASRQQPAGQKISIHALLAESDRRHWPDKTHQRISIHALLAESDG